MEDKHFSRILFSLFDRQRFEDDPRLAALIRETDERCAGCTLSDDLLEQISAAGDPLQRAGTRQKSSPGTDLTAEDEMGKDGMLFDPHL